MNRSGKGVKVQNTPQKPTPIREIDFGHYIRHFSSLFWRWKWWIFIAGPVVSVITLIYIVKYHVSDPELPATVLIGLEKAPAITTVIDFVDVDNSKAELIRTRIFLKNIVNKLSLRFQVKKYPRKSVFNKILVDTLAKSGKYVFSTNRDNKDIYTITYTNRRLGYKKKIIQSGKLSMLNSIDLPGIKLDFAHHFLRDPSKVTFYITSMPKAIESLHNNITIKKPDIRHQQFHIEVSMKGRDYNLIATILNTIADAFVEKKLMFRKRKTQSILSVLEKQHHKARSGLAVAENRLKNFRTSNPTVGLTQSTQQTVNTLTELETSVFALKDSKKEAERLESKFVSVSDEDEIQAAEEIIVFLNAQENTSAPVLQMEMNRLLSEKRALQRNHVSSHPFLQENQAGIEKLLNNVHNALTAFKMSAEDKAQEKTSGIQTLSRKLQGLPSKEVRLAELQRQHQVNAEIFSTVSDRYNQAKIAETVEVADVYVMDYAAPPIAPPMNILKLLVICILLGIAVAFGPAVFYSMINKTVRTEFELQKMTDMVVLESIPEIVPMKRGK